MATNLGFGVEKNVMRRVEDAVQRRAELHVVKLLDAVSRQDMETVHGLLESGKVQCLSPYCCSPRKHCNQRVAIMLYQAKPSCQSLSEDSFEAPETI